MTLKRQQELLLLVAIALAMGIGALHPSLNSMDRSEAASQQVRFLPNGDYLRMASLGFRELGADVLWLQAIQLIGQRRVTEAEGHWLYQLIDTLTTIDPKFVRAYEAGSHALCTLVVLPEESNRLLEKGMLHNPQEWRLPFLLGINYYFELADDEKAADAMAKAARLPGAPENLARLAAKLFVSAKSPQQAVDLLAKVYEETSDERSRELIAIRLKEAIVERDLHLLEQARSRYYAMYGRQPSRIEDLVGPGLLVEVPREPFGGHYVYESSTGSIHSSEVKERMRIPVRRRGQGL